MDLENYHNEINFQTCPSTECYYFKSSSSRIFINSVNPFRGNHCRLRMDKRKERHQRDIIDIFDNSIKTRYSVTSKGLVHENQDYEGATDATIDRSHHKQPGTTAETLRKSVISNSQPTFNNSTRVFEKPHTSSHSINWAKTNASNRQEVRFCNNQSDNHLATDDQKSEKTTYCRPIQNIYNEYFVYKTMRQNVRLQTIVTKLLLERQKQKQKEAWNNYINELKNKHGYHVNEPDRISQYLNNDEYIPNYQPSDVRLNLPRDFYTMQANSRSEYSCKYGMIQTKTRPCFACDMYCYPTSSQARLMMLERRTKLNNNSPFSKKLRGNFHIIEKDLSRVNRHLNRVQSKEHNVYNKKTNVIILRNIGTQASLDFNDSNNPDSVIKQPLENEGVKREIFEERFTQISNTVPKFKKMISIQSSDPRLKPFETIQAKLNTLIESVDSFIVEMRSKNMNNNRDTGLMRSDLSNLLPELENNACEVNKTDQVVYTSVVPNTTTIAISEIDTSMSLRKECNVKKLDQIIQEEMEKSQKIKRDIEKLLNTTCSRKCSVQMALDIPTKDISTEVTSSLSKTHNTTNCIENEVAIEEVNSEQCEAGDERQVTIAVNTDPLGLLALLRVSTDTIKQILSYMPNLNYSAYLRLLQLPQRLCVTHYVCNVCGAAFYRPSQLSEHIQKHDLGRTRDCCVCRHIVNLQKDRIGLFTCKYCSHRFTRAYCCELHQQSCAKNFGAVHDVSPNRMFLK